MATPCVMRTQRRTTGRKQARLRFESAPFQWRPFAAHRRRWHSKKGQRCDEIIGAEFQPGYKSSKFFAALRTAQLHPTSLPARCIQSNALRFGDGLDNERLSRSSVLITHDLRSIDNALTSKPDCSWRTKTYLIRCMEQHRSGVSNRAVDVRSRDS